MKVKLIQIPKIGRFKPLKSGKIHMKCFKCKLTRSNMPRESFDPINAAVLMSNFCCRCDKGGEFESIEYYDINGKIIIDD
jgi:hypothetical protein